MTVGLARRLIVAKRQLEQVVGLRVVPVLVQLLRLGLHPLVTPQVRFRLQPLLAPPHHVLPQRRVLDDLITVGLPPLVTARPSERLIKRGGRDDLPSDDQLKPLEPQLKREHGRHVPKVLRHPTGCEWLELVHRSAKPVVVSRLLILATPFTAIGIVGGGRPHLWPLPHQPIHPVVLGPVLVVNLLRPLLRREPVAAVKPVHPPLVAASPRVRVRVLVGPLLFLSLAHPFGTWLARVFLLISPFFVVRCSGHEQSLAGLSASGLLSRVVVARLLGRDGGSAVYVDQNLFVLPRRLLWSQYRFLVWRVSGFFHVLPVSLKCVIFGGYQSGASAGVIQHTGPGIRAGNADTKAIAKLLHQQLSTELPKIQRAKQAPLLEADEEQLPHKEIETVPTERPKVDPRLRA